MKALMINWAHLLESYGPNSISSLSVSDDQRNQAFADGIFPVLSMNDAPNGAADGGTAPIFTGDGSMGLDLAVPAVPELGALPVIT